MKIECFGTFLTSEEHAEIVRNKLIPDILKLIEESGISCHEATTVPDELSAAIESNLLRTLHSTAFKVQPFME